MKRMVLGCALVAFLAFSAASGADPGNGSNVNGGGPGPGAPVTTGAPTFDATINGVDFTVAGGNLTVTGDGSSSKVKLQQSGAVWQATVDTLGAVLTKVQPSRNVPISGVTGSITVNMGGGDDQLIVQKGSVATNLTIRMQDGNDKTTLSKLTIGTFLHYEGNNGEDSLTAQNVTVTDPTFAFFSSIDTQDGADSVTLKNFQEQDLEITLGDEKDHLDISESTFLGGPFQRLRIDAGDDRDVVNLKKVKTGPLLVEMGPGVGDVLSTNRCTADTATFLDTGGSNGVLHQTKNNFGSITIDPNFT